VTSKLQVTIPKAIAREYGIEPGHEVEWMEAGDAIRVVPQLARRPALGVAERLELFNQGTERQRQRQAGRPETRSPDDRGWAREDLYH